VAKKRWIQNWLVLGALGVGMIPLAIFGLFAFMAATKTPLHPTVEDVPSVTRSTPPSQWAGAVDQARQMARADLVEENLPGLSVAVGVGGEIVWAEGFGWADLDERVRVSPEMRFRIGTASIALTSAAAGLLLDQGKLQLDDEVQRYVSAYPKKERPVTLRALMGHVAGVRNDGGDEGVLFSKHCDRPADAVQFFGDDPLLFEPGSQFRVSSYGWILVSAAVEAAANEPFFTFMRRNIFTPLGMNDTKVESASGPNADWATSYFPKFAADPRYGPDRMRPLNLSCYAGASAFLSSPSDLVRFAMAINSGTLLKPATVQTLQTSQRLPSGEETGYGLGWDLETATIAGTPTRVIGHDGDLLGGQAVSFLTLPEFGIVIAVTANTSYADTYALAIKIAEAFATKQPS
jgi:serine beta-lactamase-like protein LACTB